MRGVSANPALPRIQERETSVIHAIEPEMEFAR